MEINEKIALKVIRIPPYQHQKPGNAEKKDKE